MCERLWTTGSRRLVLINMVVHEVEPISVKISSSEVVCGLQVVQGMSYCGEHTIGIRE